MNKSEGIKERIKQARVDQGFTQKGLATKSGLDESHVSHLETGVRRPNIDTLYKLCDALDRTPNYFLGYEG